MRKVEVSESDRRLVRLLMRWRRVTVGSVAKLAAVDPGNLSRLVGNAGTPGLGATKVEAVLRELGWSSRGPTAGSVARWTVDVDDDVVWMFKDVLRGRAQVAVLVNNEKTLDLLDHMGVLLCFWGTSLIVLDAAVGNDDLIDKLLENPELTQRRSPVVIARASDFERVQKGLFHVQELNGMIFGSTDDFVIPEPLLKKLWALYSLLGSESRLDELVHDVEILMARSFSNEFFGDMLSDLKEWRFGDRPPGASLSNNEIAKLRNDALSMSERKSKESFQLPWIEMNE